jgi:hypothetical protein
MPHTPARLSSPYNSIPVRSLRTPDIMAEPSLENLRSPLIPSKRGREIVSGMCAPAKGNIPEVLVTNCNSYSCSENCGRAGFRVFRRAGGKAAGD